MSRRKMRKKMTKHIFQDPKITTLFLYKVNRQKEKQDDSAYFNENMIQRMIKNIFQDPKIPTLILQNVNRQKEEQIN
jgi:hypothetical protein